MPSVTRKASKVRDRRRPEITARLMTAIEELLAEGTSYTELSVDRITTTADLPRSTFYLYFGDKSDLLEALAGDVVDGLLAPVREWIELPADVRREDIAAVMHRLFERHLDHALLLKAVVDVSSYDPAISERLRGLIYQAVDLIEAHIALGQGEGAVRPDIDPRVTAEWLTWMTERGLYQLVAGADPKRLRALADSLANILWITLYEGAPARQA